MTTVLVAWGQVALLGLGTAVTGRALAALCGVRPLRRLTPETLAASAVLGTGAWALVLGWFFYAGLAAPAALVGLLVVLGCLLAGLVVCRRLGLALRPHGAPVAWVGAAVVALVGASLVLLPLARHHFFDPFNDTTNYASIAEWLQHHGFGLSAPAQSAPGDDTAHIIQGCYVGNERMGAMFLLALVQAAFPGSSALEAFPVVMAWGVLLNAAAGYCLARWALRLPPRFAAIVPVLLLVAVGPMHYSVQAGFLSQVHGTALLVTALALLARLRPLARGDVGVAGAFGLAAAALVSVYHEIAPVLAAAVAGFVAWHLWRAPSRVRRRLLLLAALSLACFAVLNNVGLIRAARGIWGQFHVQQAGYHLDWPALRYWAFALGCAPFGASFGGLKLLVTVPVTVCLAAGLVRLWRRRQPAVVAVLALLVALAAYHALAVDDPWTGERGQSWALFKLCKWAYPLTATLLAGGAYLLLRRLPRQRLALAAAGVALLVLAVPQHLRRGQAQDARAVLASPRPFRAIRQLRARVAHLPGRFRLLHDDPSLWPGRFLVYALYPAACSAPWPTRPEQQTGYTPGVHYLVVGRPPFEGPIEELPCGLSRIDGRRPLVFQVVRTGQTGAMAHGSDAPPRLTPQPLRLLVWSPAAGPARLTLTAAPGEKPARSGCRLRVSDAGGRTQVAQAAWGAPAELTIRLPVGISRLEVSCPEEARLTDARLRLLDEQH